MDQLKLIDAQVVARGMMYLKEKWFEYRDKPGRTLACLLEQMGHRLILSMKRPDGTMTMSVKKKLEIFAEFYRDLYSSSDPHHGSSA